VDKETFTKELNLDFPSLQAAASVREKKHSCPAAVAHKFKKKLHISDFVGADHSLIEDQSQSEPVCDTSETPESIPACNTFVDYSRSVPCKMAGWTELQRKSSSSDDDIAASQKRKVSTDKELEKPVVGSTTMVLSDFLPPSQLSGSVPPQSPEFIPMLMCTLCGDRTHSCRDCSRRRLGELFCD